MKLQFLKDDELETSFQQAVKSERKIMHIVVLHVQELQRRKLYLARGYSSLFEYMVKEAKYSSSSAQRRIEAARLLTAVPEVSENLQNGDLNLSQIADLQRAVKQAERIHQVEVTATEKAELVQSVLNQSQSNTQQICAKMLEIPLVENEVIKTQKNQSKRIEVTFTKEQYEKYEKLKGLLAHKNFQAKRSQSISDVLETIFDEVLKKKDPSEILSEVTKPALKARGDFSKAIFEPKIVSAKQRSGNSIAGAATGCGIDAELLEPEREVENGCDIDIDVELLKTEPEAETLSVTTWKSLTPKRKRIILNEDQRCQFTDHKTGRQCGTTFNLEVDHIHPKWAGGGSDPQNLRVLCRQHNAYRYCHSQ